ncbi:MAG TPA: hypothetical protein VK906_13165 [Egicoccus sp.]|nr:hypothetical protein [Egicoccus sp.]HSK24128.1 hypothetical protein [Egicoccus sp.]
MRWLRVVRAELLKLTTTRLLWGFLAALVAIAAINALAIVLGTDMDGSKTFISTAEDQRSLLAFGVNAMLGTGLFGAIAVAREYGHATVVPTFLSTPRRHLAVLAQFTAVMIGGLVLGLFAEALVLGVGAVSLQFTDHAFMLSAGTVVQLLATSMLAGAVGSVLGGGIGAIVRNGGGAVAVTIFVLFIAPQMAPQLIADAAQWMPATLLTGIAGVADGPTLAAALAALLAWAALMSLLAVGTVQRRDVV